MNNLFLPAAAFVGGIFLAAQGVFNSRLGVLLNNPLLAAAVAFISSALFASIVIIAGTGKTPGLAELKAIPFYLWFTGGLLSVIGIGIYYYTIPRLGISAIISLGLSGQLLFSFIAGHFGLFGMPVEPITLTRTIGLISMLAGIIILNNN